VTRPAWMQRMGADAAELTAVRLDALARSRAARNGAHAGPESIPRAPDPRSSADYDVVFAGGGLSLAIAPLLAASGLSVGVFERHRAGVAHREWNASADELQSLLRARLLEPAELERAVVARYDSGVCRWFGGATTTVKGVLDHAVDAGYLLGLVRERAERAGVHFHDGHVVVAERAAAGRVAVRVRDAEGRTRDVVSRALVDARGASSPYATADLVCPTVGGVLRGLDEGDGPAQINPLVGEILATTENVEEGRQHVWEAFPGRPGEVTVYLFYYARSADVPPDALSPLYDRFFRTLPRFKSGEATLVRPTFGYIPGWSRLSPAPRAPAPNVFLVGDAAARQSPLTYCGFGHMLRTFSATASRIERQLQSGADVANHDGESAEREALHAGTGALSLMMSSPPADPARAGELNALLDAAFGTLEEMGQDSYRDLLRDDMHPRDFIEFLRRTARRHPAVYPRVFDRLGSRAVARWGMQLVAAQWRSRKSRSPQVDPS